MTVNWNGRTFGQLTEEERAIVTADAATKMAEELERNADAIADLLDDEEHVRAEPYCDYCEREGHTFTSCPRRDDESEVDL